MLWESEHLLWVLVHGFIIKDGFGPSPSASEGGDTGTDHS